MPAKRTAIHDRRRDAQRGAALMVMLVIMIVGIAAIFVSSLNSSALHIERDKVTADALAQAKDALIGYSVKQASVTDTGYLPLPDIGWTITPEGNAEGTYGGTDFSLIGKLPWKTLGIAPVKHGDGECLWYILSGRFKNSPPTPIFNWDTLGQIDVIDANGNTIINNVAALIIAPGSVLASQNRSLADPALTQCGGNYDARNYLDSYNTSDAIAGEVNYFVNYDSYTNNMLAPNTNNKRFVMASNDHYNDRFLFITVDDIFHPIIRRSDFSTQVSALLNDADFLSHLENVNITGAGTKGTGNVDCTVISNPDNQTFCNNWKEMLLLTRLNPKSPITIDGASTDPTDCKRVLIFGGQKTATQARLTVTDKADPTNYLEAQNFANFAVPSTNSTNFIGNENFNANSPSADLLRCLP